MTVASTSPQTDTGSVILAINVEGDDVPEWIELIPPGVEVTGRDGRSWINDQPEAVVAATGPCLPFPLDWEHATEVRAPQGLDAPAAGWIEEVQAREGGAVWGRVAWTPRGRDQVGKREYRFVSPGFDFAKASRRIVRLVHAGLTNTPNLVLTALNREERRGITREMKETTLDLATRLRQALGLAEDATDDAIVTAVNSARAVNRPDLTTYAPRSELETAINRATVAEAARDALQKEKTDAAIETAINSALDAGKIIPASADTYRAMCAEEGGLERFNALVATLPVIAGASDARALNKVKAPDGAASALTDEERAVCRALNQSEDDFLKSKSQKEA